MVHYRYSHVSTVKDDATKPEVADGLLLKAFARAALPVRCLLTAHTVTFVSRPHPQVLHFSLRRMALLSSASLRTCARPTAAPRAAVVAPRGVVCRAQAKQEEALKMAQDLLSKGMDAAKNVDVNAVCRSSDIQCLYVVFLQLEASRMHWLSLYSLRSTHHPGTIQSHQQCLPCMASLSRTS
jgi:hypothetical protein